MICRIGCGACCISPSISSPLPGMPLGKPAGVRCVNLDDTNQCRVWGTKEYPEVCRGFLPTKEVCADSREEALTILFWWEQWTKPAESRPRP